MAERARQLSVVVCSGFHASPGLGLHNKLHTSIRDVVVGVGHTSVAPRHYMYSWRGRSDPT